MKEKINLKFKCEHSSLGVWVKNKEAAETNASERLCPACCRVIHEEEERTMGFWRAIKANPVINGVVLAVISERAELEDRDASEKAEKWGVVEQSLPPTRFLELTEQGKKFATESEIKITYERIQLSSYEQVRH